MTLDAGHNETGEPLLADLFERARGGDRIAMNQVLSVLRPQLRAFAASRRSTQLDRRVDASDLAQEALLETYRALGPDFRGDSEAELQKWVQQILRSKHVDALRRHILAERRSLNAEVSIDAGPQADRFATPLDWSSPSQHAMRNEREQRLHAALSRLSPDQAAAIRLVYLQKLSLEEVRSRLDKPTTNAVTKLLRRGMDRLQDLLGHDG